MIIIIDIVDVIIIKYWEMKPISGLDWNYLIVRIYYLSGIVYMQLWLKLWQKMQFGENAVKYWK